MIYTIEMRYPQNSDDRFKIVKLSLDEISVKTNSKSLTNLKRK